MEALQRLSVQQSVENIHDHIDQIHEDKQRRNSAADVGDLPRVDMPSPVGFLLQELRRRRVNPIP